MESIDLAHRVAEILVDKQGEDILILDLRDVTTFTDYLRVLCRNRHRFLASYGYSRRLETAQQA